MRGCHIGINRFSCRYSILVKLEFGDNGFHGERKTREPGKKPLEKGKNQLQTQPTFGTRTEFNLGHNGGRQVLSPLHHHCYPKTSYQLQSVSFKERKPIVFLKSSDNLTTADTRFTFFPVKPQTPDKISGMFIISRPIKWEMKPQKFKSSRD